MNTSSLFCLSQWKAEKHDQTARHGLQRITRTVICVTLPLSTVKETDCSLIWTAGYSKKSITASFFARFLVLAFAMVLAISTISEQVQKVPRFDGGKPESSCWHEFRCPAGASVDERVSLNLWVLGRLVDCLVAKLSHFGCSHYVEPSRLPMGSLSASSTCFCNKIASLKKWNW